MGEASESTKRVGVGPIPCTAACLLGLHKLTDQKEGTARGDAPGPGGRCIGLMPAGGAPIPLLSSDIKSGTPGPIMYGMRCCC